MKLFGANIANASRSPELAAYLATYHPDVVVLSEAYRWRHEISGYQTLKWSKRRHGPEARDLMVLVRDGVKVKRKRLRKMDRRWFGPFTLRRREPRRYPVVVVKVDGVRWPILAAHLPPGGASGGVRTRGRNKGAWHESARKIKRWLRKRPRAVVAGDLNDNRASVKKHIAPKRGRVVMASNVDGVVAVGARITLKRLPVPTGMHGWFLATLKEKP